MPTLLTEDDILSLIREDSWMMSLLETVATLHLSDWWIGAGFVRSKVWDYLHEYQRPTPLPDIDVIYFDPTDLTEESEEHILQQLKKLNPYVAWQVKNQARMHILHNDPPYANATEGLSRWVETATCVGVTLDTNNQLHLTAPLGIDDLVNLIVKPNPTANPSLSLFKKRVRQKQWLTKWPKLRVSIDK